MRHHICKSALGLIIVIIFFFCELNTLSEVSAQDGIRRPEETRPKLLPFKPPKRPPGNVLPPVPIPKESEIEGLYKGIEVFISKVKITGNTVFREGELDAIVTEFVESKRSRLTFSDLERLRDLITLKYVNKGYITSGAVIPDQEIVDGSVEIKVIEGVLSEVDVETDGRLKKNYVKNRIFLAVPGIVNTKQVEKKLQILQQNPRIANIKASLIPSEDVRGESVLKVNISEAKAYRALFQFDNLEPPSIGSERFLLDFSHFNVSGYGDSFFSIFRYTEGLHGLFAAYEVPLNARDTTLRIHIDLSEAEVVEEPFDALDIESESQTYGFVLSHPFHRSLNAWFDVFLIGEKRRSKTFLFGEGFQFSEGASDEGVSEVTAMRFGQTWNYRTRNQSFALRNTVSIGLDLFDATTHGDSDQPDGQFLTWLGQAQYARRFYIRGFQAELQARGDIQLSDSPLLNLERIGVGGYWTVRGYRENEFVRDNAMIGSLELKVPLLTYKQFFFELVPFYDIGRAWNENETPSGPKTISGAGVGLNWAYRNRLFGSVYWSHAFEDIDQPGEYSLQDDGIYFRISLDL